MRFHLVSVPHTQTTSQYSACAFTEKVRKFAVMMKSRGHHVTLYAGDENEAPCDELVTCMSAEERQSFFGHQHFTAAKWDASLPSWKLFNERVIEGIRARMQPRDIICVIGGHANKLINDAIPTLPFVEFGIGYGGSYSYYRIFESYAWMHTTYGSQSGPNPNAAKGDHWFHAVIPGYFEPEKFPTRSGTFVHQLMAGIPAKPSPTAIDDSWSQWRQDLMRRRDDEELRLWDMFTQDRRPYFFFIGRFGAGKGEGIAAQICQTMGHRLILAGTGGPVPTGSRIQFVGEIGPYMRGELMANAEAVLMPTEYIEPFGNVAVEAQACGTPVITTDWGAMTETVVHGRTGYRCRSFQEFCDATTPAALRRLAKPNILRDRVVRKYSTQAIALKYEQYFERLLTLYGGRGWYELRQAA